MKLNRKATRAKEEKQEQDAGDAKPTICCAQQSEAGREKASQKPDEHRRQQQMRRRDPQEERNDQWDEWAAQPVDLQAPFGALLLQYRDVCRLTHAPPFVLLSPPNRASLSTSQGKYRLY